MEDEYSVQISEKRSALQLFRYFFKIGFYTFGGGWSIVAQMQKEYVEKRHWLTEEDLLDITSVGRSLPGLMVGNVSYLFGYHMAGFPGALACLFGVALPPLLILTILTWCYTQVAGNVYVMRAMTGVRAAVAPIIASAALGLRKGALTDKSSYCILLLGLVLYLAFGVNCILLILLGGLLGYLFSPGGSGGKEAAAMVFLELFWSFCKIGFSSFGGLSMVPLINDEMLSHGWMTLMEVSDIVAIAEITPGPLGLNCATFAGTRVAGVLGGLCASLGVLSPTLLLCSIAAVAFEKFRDSSFMKKVMTGVRPISLGLVLGVLISLSTTNYVGMDGFLSPSALAVGAAAAIALLVCKLSIPKTILLSAVLGLLLVR